MNSPWLILDCNYLCHRAFHSMPNLTAGDVPTAVPFGFLRELVALQNRFQTRQTVFTFDHGPFLRQQVYPAYKANRKPRTTVEEAVGRAIHCQIAVLMQHLDDLGFANILHCQGYEADDVIASVVQRSLPAGAEAVLVSSDKDLYQLLSPNVSMYDPRKHELYTEQRFKDEWGVSAGSWYRVKAIAGCPGDGVLGVRGVAEKTAVKYLSGALAPSGEKSKAIRAELARIRDNVPLVRLPYDGCPTFALGEDNVTVAKWQAVCDRLQLKSLRDDPPACAKRR